MIISVTVVILLSFHHTYICYSSCSAGVFSIIIPVGLFSRLFVVFYTFCVIILILILRNSNAMYAKQDKALIFFFNK